MKTLKKISSFVLVFCILQWPSGQVDSASSSASSSQLSFGPSNGDQSKDATSTGLLGALYHKSRQSRCVTCYDDRYDDRSRYHGGGYSSRSVDDRSGSWYYPRNDRYDDRHRGGEADRYGGGGLDRYGGGGADRYGGGGADRYGGGGGADRYGGGGGYRDDRYDTRSTYDRYDSRGYSDRRGSYDRGESRGYGYDNRDRYYGGERGGEYSPRDRYYDRPRYGSSSVGGGAPGYGYDRDYYDRYSPRYDFRSNRPSWDGTYSKGQSGYDNSGRGYYTNKAGKEDRRYLPEPGYRSPGSSPCGVQKPNCPYGFQDGGSRVTSGPIDSGNHNIGVSHSTYNPGGNQNNSAKGSGSGSGWSYMREDDADRQPSRGGSGSSGGGSGVSGGGGGGNGDGGNGSASASASNRDRNRDQQSPAYGALLDRGSNLIAVEPAKTTEDGQENTDKSQSSSASHTSSTVDDNGQQHANGQNS